MDCFFGLFASSYLCFLWSEWYFIVISCKFLLSNSSIFSFNHNIPSTIYTLYHHLFHQFIYYCFCSISFIYFSACVNHTFIMYSTEVSRFLGGAPTSICHFFCSSVSPFILPSMVHHISGTVHHLNLIFGTLAYNADICRCFFHFFKILIFQVVSGIKGQKMAQNDKNYVSYTSYLKNRTSHDPHFW